jgi:FKBP-type peptidyl-prolyl cis-trans isomerase FkpA
MHGDLLTISNRLIIKISALLIFIVTLTGCGNNHEPAQKRNPLGKNELADINRYFVQKDRERIQNYIERKNLNMVETPTGLWYQILKEGSGRTFSDYDQVEMEYVCSLLDGTSCYSSEKLGNKKLILGKSQIEPGMNEGLRLLRPGAEAILIMPPFLAYGLLGDGKLIPSRAVIVYKVNILQAEK